MRLQTSTLGTKQTRRSLLAALFLIVFLAEAGSHAMICSNHSSSSETFVSSSDSGHDDPCKSLVLCSDNKRNERQLPGFSHDSMQHNAMFDRGADLADQFDLPGETRIPFATGYTLFRPPTPPFHPPELS